MFRFDAARAKIIETCDSRVLGALRFADATTGAWITSPLRVSSARATLVRNRSGVFVITGAAGFDPDTGLPVPAEPAPEPPPALEIDVADPAGRYLDRRVRVSLPRDPDPEHGGEPNWLFRAQRVPLYPAPAAFVHPGQAPVRVTVREAGTSRGIPHVWLRLSWARPEPEPDEPEPDEPGDGDDAPEEPAPDDVDAEVVELLGTGMTDARGEALVAVSGVPVTNWDAAGDGPVLATEIDAVLDAYVDVDASSPPDPDAIDAERESLPTVRAELKIASGRETIVRLALTLPPPD
jgi:hypothetical protein